MASLYFFTITFGTLLNWKSGSHSHQTYGMLALRDSLAREIKLCTCCAHSIKKKRKELGGFSPISVLNDLVKIISKVLVNRLRDVLGDIINDHQTKFLKCRSILDSITTAWKVIQFTKRNKVSGFI